MERMGDHLKTFEHLRNLPFVRDLRYRPGSGVRDNGWDGEIKVRTPKGSFSLAVEIKTSNLLSASVNEFLVRAGRSHGRRHSGIMLAARHVPRLMAERLISHHINFADLAGNLHLELGDAYNWTVIGRPEPKPISVRRAATPAQIQLLFQFVTEPGSIAWPVRQLEKAAGISKSRAAQARKQLVSGGLLVREGKRYKPARSAALSERLVPGYSEILRPKIFMNRFRYPEKQPAEFLSRLQAEAQRTPSLRYALTGGPAADLLQHFYQGEEVPMFVNQWDRSIQQRLRLLPDRDGPVIALRAFGDVVYWREEGGHMVAPPWLVYAELLANDDPRAHEAADELRREFLE